MLVADLPASRDKVRHPMFRKSNPGERKTIVKLALRSISNFVLRNLPIPELHEARARGQEMEQQQLIRG